MSYHMVFVHVHGYYPPLSPDLLCDPDIIQNFHDLFVYREYEGHIKANSAQTRNSAFIKPGEKNVISQN